MVQTTEFRIPMPMTVEEYRIGQLYSIAMMSKEETSGGEGVEVLKNEPFENKEYGKGQYTYKIYHVAKRTPGWIQKILPAKMLDFHEEAWNAYPFCKTVITSPFLGDKFGITITSMHKQDRGESENVLNLQGEELKRRKVCVIDIANDKWTDKYEAAIDPKVVKSAKANRGPLNTVDWVKKDQIVMTCYKLVEVKARIIGFQTKLESKISEIEENIFRQLHRKMFCGMDQWILMTMADIRTLEDDIQKELALKFNKTPAAAASSSSASPVTPAPSTPASSSTTHSFIEADDAQTPVPDEEELKAAQEQQQDK